MKPTPASLRRLCLACTVASCVAAGGGCSSVIGSAYLREAWLDAVEHAADKAAEERQEAAARGPAGSAGKTAAATPAGDRVGEETAATLDTATPRYAAIDEAVADADRRLEKVGGLTPAARETLTAMLGGLSRQDWPVAVDEFTAALAEAEPSRPAPPAAAVSVAAADPMPPLPPVEPLAPRAAEPSQLVPETPETVAAAPQPEPPPAPPALAVQNACFATRVRAWGAVDRFEGSQFAPGQEVIVYFELEHLASKESADGHSTRVDTRLKLVAADGRRLHEWTFEPLEETCRAPRRDYFARYVLAFPESAPAGPCRLEVSVTDAVAGRTAQTTLPLELRGR